MKKPEILAPAGDLSKLTAAINFGADAVYLGGKEFSMRSASQNFSPDDLRTGVQYAHARGVKVYYALNTIPDNAEAVRIPEIVRNAATAGVDAFIVADLGVMEAVKQAAPNVHLHVSTQMGVMNYASANVLYKLGARRIVLAREVTLREIAEIRAKVPDDLELEAFVHGAMCVSFSGRCLISNYMTGRDSNRGKCAQPCRWNYTLMEEKRPGEYFPVFEDESGTYIMNSKDLCMIEHIPELIEAGIDSFKIEGRVKTEIYVATITNAYKKAVEAYCKDPKGYRLSDVLRDEVQKVSHRHYSTGFFFGKDKAEQHLESSSYIRNYEVTAIIESIDQDTAVCRIKNPMRVQEQLEVLSPDGIFDITISEIKDEAGETIEAAVHPEMIVRIPFPKNMATPAFIRKRV